MFDMYADELDRELAELEAQRVLTQFEKDFPSYFERG